ncbi:la-related protein 1-like [Neopelma chrysocephalum]|uniref:la-related protein 1-like n=1 Tax=Neopelma chrysocephalum TaxID=114329 RepID=UPI000FCCFE86|nr:la-related protein 1-like [Neopelma chrysocephalum]
MCRNPVMIWMVCRTGMDGNEVNSPPPPFLQCRAGRGGALIPQRPPRDRREDGNPPGTGSRPCLQELRKKGEKNKKRERKKKKAPARIPGRINPSRAIRLLRLLPAERALEESPHAPSPPAGTDLAAGEVWEEESVQLEAEGVVSTPREEAGAAELPIQQAPARVVPQPRSGCSSRNPSLSALVTPHPEPRISSPAATRLPRTRSGTVTESHEGPHVTGSAGVSELPRQTSS